MGSAVTRPAIAFGVDERYLPPLLVTLTSLASGGVNGDVATVHVLHTDLGPEASARLLALGDALDLHIELVLAQRGSDRFPITDWISEAAYLRLQIPDAIPHHDRILYLDCDLVAVGPLHELLDLEPTGVLAAVQDPTNPTFGEGDAVPGFAELGLSPDAPYFNSGVMVIDRRAWIDTGLTDRCVRRLLDQPHHIKYWDQDALNIELADGGWDPIDPTFNAVVVSAYAEAAERSGDPQRIAAVKAGAEAESRASILHFAGPFKPWNPGYPECEARRAYASFADALQRIEAGDYTLARGAT
jgi:lipopolysaccharide biosynthesis glycosyltransferase